MQEPEPNDKNNQELDRIRGTAEFAKLMAERAQSGLKALETQVDSQGRKTVGSVIALILIAVAGGVGAWLLTTKLEDRGISLAKVPAIERSVNAIGERLKLAEDALGELPAKWDSLTGRISAVDRKVDSARAQSARDAARPATRQAVVVPVHDQEAENHIALLNERVGTLESQHSADLQKHEADLQRIDSLNDTLGALREETNRQISAVRAEIPREAVSRVASLQSEVAHSQAAIDSIENQIARERRKFEIQKGQAGEVIPGVLMNVKDMNVDRQQVSGWIYLQNRKQYIVLTNRGRFQPVTFFSPEDQQQHDIVITSVTKRQVDGYVLSPKATNAAIADN